MKRRMERTYVRHKGIYRAYNAPRTRTTQVWKHPSILFRTMKAREGGESSAVWHFRNSIDAARLVCLVQDAATDADSYLVLTLKVLEKSFVEICGDAVEQWPQHSLRKLVVVQIFDLHRGAKEDIHNAAVRKTKPIWTLDVAPDVYNPHIIQCSTPCRLTSCVKNTGVQLWSASNFFRTAG